MCSSLVISTLGVSMTCNLANSDQQPKLQPSTINDGRSVALVEHLKITQAIFRA